MKVSSVKCRVRGLESVECGAYFIEGKVSGVERTVSSLVCWVLCVECGVSSAKCKVWSVEGGV